MKVELPLGDIVDKITILHIKSKKISTPAKLHNIRKELSTLEEAWSQEDYPAVEDLPEWNGLLNVNEELWVVEDELRLLEAKQDFGPAFIKLARSVYFLNDKRASLKKSINIALGSTLIEEKSYQDYGQGSGKE